MLRRSQQHYLGEMYSNGHGVPQQIETGLRWYEEAAQGGHQASQTQLGTLYVDGVEGVPADRAKAHAWLSMAAASGDPTAGVQRDETAEAMPLHELEKARDLYRQWLADDEL